MLKIYNNHLFIFLMFIFIISGCGIPSIPYIDPPEVSSPVTTLSEYDVRFRNAYKNNPVYFYGYSIYYRFFSSEDNLDTVVNDLSGADDINDLQDEDFNFMYRMSDEEGLGRNGGTPVTIEIDEADRNDSFYLTLDFYGDIVYSDSDSEDNDESLLFGTVITYPDEDSNINYLGRYIEQNRINISSTEDAVNRSFKDNAFSEEDADLPDNNSFEFGVDDMLYLAVYVLSFGRDTVGVPIYSEPVYLGKFEIPVNTL